MAILFPVIAVAIILIFKKDLLKILNLFRATSMPLTPKNAAEIPLLSVSIG